MRIGLPCCLQQSEVATTRDNSESSKVKTYITMDAASKTTAIHLDLDDGKRRLLDIIPYDVIWLAI